MATLDFRKLSLRDAGPVADKAALKLGDGADDMASETRSCVGACSTALLMCSEWRAKDVVQGG